MTMTIRKQLSVAAWGAAGFFSLILLLSANAAVHHLSVPQTDTTGQPASPSYSNQPAE